MDLEAEYNNRARVPEHPAIIAGWARDAAAFRAAAKAEIDLAYGARPRNRLDLFWPATDAGGPIVLFIHGGYWRAFDKSSFSHMAAGPNSHGLPVAVAGYTLCPDSSIPDIIDEMRQAALFLWHRLARPIIAIGQSAGGHLAAALLATNWTAYGAPASIMPAAMAISGIYDLRPLVGLALNADLKLDERIAITASPLFWPAPRGVQFEASVGASESREFIRQSETIIAAWAGLGLDARFVAEEGENHFSIVRHLANPASPLCTRLQAIALRRSRPL